MLRPYFQRHRHLLKRLCTLAHESPEGVPGIIMTLHTLLRQARPAGRPVPSGRSRALHVRTL